MEGLITSSVGILFVLAANCALWFFLEKKTGWKIFNYIPPLVFIYIIWMGDNILPVFLTLLLLDVDVRATVKVMGRGVFVMLIGSLGVIVGAPIGYLLVKGWLGPDSWKGFGALAGSWIGGTGNMAAVSEGDRFRTGRNRR